MEMEVGDAVDVDDKVGTNRVGGKSSTYMPPPSKQLKTKKMHGMVKEVARLIRELKREKQLSLDELLFQKKNHTKEPPPTIIPTAPNLVGSLPACLTHSTNEPTMPTTSSKCVIGGSVSVSLGS
ncbi:hypothetical protein GH714_002751 [Hevea brasiliensis]|uniref:Uncharacterized protein n=1 Tax=Hevea brasiliensis TaxID=3981 RepID=A0A6A6KMC3_HEVBR|nr:hypothetical protein GH714_002751 [Hevea brasiliensis]